MAQPIGFEQVEPAVGIQLKDKDGVQESGSDEKLLVDVEGGRPRLDTAARVGGWVAAESCPESPCAVARCTVHACACACECVCSAGVLWCSVLCSVLQIHFPTRTISI